MASKIARVASIYHQRAVAHTMNTKSTAHIAQMSRTGSRVEAPSGRKLGNTTRLPSSVHMCPAQHLAQSSAAANFITHLARHVMYFNGRSCMHHCPQAAKQGDQTTTRQHPGPNTSEASQRNASRDHRPSHAPHTRTAPQRLAMGRMPFAFEG